MNLLSVKEVARMMGVTTRCVQRWCETKQLPYIKIGKTIRILGNEIPELSMVLRSTHYLSSLDDECHDCTEDRRVILAL